MEDDKISSDVSDKRKVEEDNISPKPNPKRIKLVRPVFSLLAKPTISPAIEINKSDEQPKEILKPSNSFVKVVNVDDISQLPEKYIDKSESIKKSIDQSETIIKNIDPLETVKISTVSPLVLEEQVDIRSDDLDIKNIFSEETKKELENLKKNIFKIEDDGSSSENDSQPKRPRLKRPTFVTSAIENKVDSIDKINETSNLDLTACEDNINTITVKQLSTEENTDKLLEHVVENIKINEIGHTNISTENITQKKLIITENDEKILEESPIVTENIDKIGKENSFSSGNNEILVEEITTKVGSIDNIIAEETADVDNLCEVPKKVIEVKYDDVKIRPKANTICTNLQEVEEKKENNLHKIKTIDIEVDNEKVEGQSLKKVSNCENIIKEINDTVKNSDINEILTSSVKVILERFDKNNDIIQNEKPILNVKLEDHCKITVKTNSNNIIEEGSMKYNKDENIEKSIKCTVIDTKKDLQIDKTIETIKDDKSSSLKNEDHKFNKTPQVENKTNCSSNILVMQESSTNVQKHDECESQIFKSDILKAALMSKKSPETLLDSLEGQDQLVENIYTTSLKIKKIANLPKIGEEAIVNKIEAEIKFGIKEYQINNKKSQNKIPNNVSEMNISKELSTSISNNDNITISKNEEPPKWGSAKMNEVEKFLNDSNVTITPICKSQESPKLSKITLKLPKVGNPEIKSETTVRPDVKSELIKKITNKQIAMGESPLKNALSQPSKSFSDFATIRPASTPSAEQIALLEQQILNTPKRRGRPSKALAQQKQLLLQYQQQQQKAPEGSAEDEAIFHVPLFDMEDMSGGTGMFDPFDALTPKRGKGMRGKGSRGRRGRGGRSRGRDESDSDTTLNRRHIDNEGETYNEEMNQEEETKQVAIIETERLRKEEERERKIEARKRKLKERSDALKEKKMKKKQKAEERRLQWHEKKRLMQEEKARAAEMKKSLPPPQNFDDETRMSADCNNSLSQTPARNFMLGEDDLSISGTTNDSIRLKKGRMEVIDLESNKTLTVDQIAEYQWPLEGGELYMIQEQISNFLGVKSFKRKYPGLKRRNVEAEERTFLCDSGLVAESLCDLGLTVLYSSEVLDVMYSDFPEKYEELREYMRLKHAKELSNRQRALMTISSNTDGSKLDLRDRAMEAVANWNANLNKSRLESRKCSMDMQTFIVHYPKNKCKKMTVPKPKIGNYPLALLPGQFCDYYATYSSDDLHYLPINTVMYGPLKSVDKDFPVSLSSQSESEDSSSDDSSDSDDSVDIDDKSGKNDMENGPSDKKGAECKLCFGSADKNKKGLVEPLIHCSKCLTIYHPTCLDMTMEMIPYIKRYNWQCNECKSCAQCKEVADEDKMLFCDLCDRGYHIYCVGLRRVPEGRWHCQECAMCSSCGVSDPGPGDSKWFYEFKKMEKTGSKVYCRTLCAPCSRLWKKGHYCPNCMRCYPIKNVERMTQCNSCDRYLHPECISENTSTSQVVACTICEEKAVSRLLTTVPRSLIKV